MMCSTAREIMLSSLLSSYYSLVKNVHLFFAYLEGSSTSCVSKGTNELLFQFPCLIDNPRFSYLGN